MTKAVVFLAPGFEEIEAVTVVDILRRAAVEVTVAGIFRGVIEGSHGIRLAPDRFVDDLKMGDFDAAILPGGGPGTENLRKDKRVLTIVRDFFNAGKLVAAICAAPAVLSDAGILRNRDCTIYPGMEDELEKGGGKPKTDLVVEDGNVVTSRGPATALPFALKLAERLAGKETAERVREKTLANESLKK